MHINPEDEHEIANPYELGQMVTCVGGPLDGRDMPIEEPLDVETRYPDIYYHDELGGIFYQKTTNEKGEEVCHWYCVLIEQDPKTPTRWWKYYAYRGAHPEDALDRPDGYSPLENYPAVPPGFPQYDQED
jgi:hypothetical protein